MEKDGRKKYITERNGRTCWERQGIVAFCTWQWNEWMKPLICLVLSLSFHNHLSPVQVLRMIVGLRWLVMMKSRIHGRKSTQPHVSSVDPRVFHRCTNPKLTKLGYSQVTSKAALLQSENWPVANIHLSTNTAKNLKNSRTVYQSINCRDLADKMTNLYLEK